MLLFTPVVVIPQMNIAKAAADQPDKRRKSKANETPTETCAMTMNQVKRMGQSSGIMADEEKIRSDKGYQEDLSARMDGPGAWKNSRNI